MGGAMGAMGAMGRDGDSLNCAIFWPLPGRLAIGGSLNRAIFCPFPA